MEPEKAAMSFEDKRAAFLKAAEKESSGRGVVKKVGFSNGAVTEFLKQYREFQEESRRVELLAR